MHFCLNLSRIWLPNHDINHFKIFFRNLSQTPGKDPYDGGETNIFHRASLTHVGEAGSLQHE